MLLTVIPHYNSSDLLRYTLDSIAKGSRRPDKVIIVDDGSNSSESNSLLHLVDSFKEDLNVVLDLRSLNEGLVKIREYVWSTYVRELKPNYFHFLDSDDLVHPDFYQQGLSFIDDSNEEQAVFSFPYRSFSEINDWDELTLLSHQKIKPLKLGTHSRLIWRLSSFDFLADIHFDYHSPYEDWIFYSRVTGVSMRSVNGTPAIAYRRGRGSLSFGMNALSVLKQKYRDLSKSNLTKIYIIFNLLLAEVKKVYRSAQRLR